MSRLYEFLEEETSGCIVNHRMVKRILFRYISDVSVTEENEPCKAAFLKFDFNYCVRQVSLVSNKEGWQYYMCSLEGRMNHKFEVSMFLTVQYEYSSTCPCSLSMSKQYESEHAQNLTDRGNGTAIAHSQRSQAVCTVEIPYGSHFFVEDLLEILQPKLSDFCRRIASISFPIATYDFPQRTKKVRLRKS